MWLKLTDTACDNKKIRRLAAVLGVSYPEALDHLALLWLWRIEDGDLSGFTSEEIAMAARWRGSPADLVEVLQLAGFIDQANGRLMLHDHEEHQGSVKEARRKARQRAKKRGVPAGGDDRPPLSRDMVESGGLSRDQFDPVSQDSHRVSRDQSDLVSQDSHRVSRDSDAHPETDPLEIEIERKLDALFELPSQL